MRVSVVSPRRLYEFFVSSPPLRLTVFSYVVGLSWARVFARHRSTVYVSSEKIALSSCALLFLLRRGVEVYRVSGLHAKLVVVGDVEVVVVGTGNFTARTLSGSRDLFVVVSDPSVSVRRSVSRFVDSVVLSSVRVWEGDVLDLCVSRRREGKHQQR